MYIVPFSIPRAARSRLAAALGHPTDPAALMETIRMSFDVLKAPTKANTGGDASVLMTDETRQSPAETVSHDWSQDQIDDDMFRDDEEEEDREADCGRWRNGRLVPQCLLAGSEWCDWDCPIGLPVRRKRPNTRQGDLGLAEQLTAYQRPEGS